MPTFAYQAVDSAGKKTRGVLTAVSPGAVAKSLEDRGLLVLDVAESKGGAATKSKGFRTGRRREVLEVTRAMASLLPAGMPLAQTLSASANVATGDVAAAVLEIRSRVERGESLSVALSEFPHLFSPMYIGLVRAGEKSGDVDGAFKRLAMQIEKDEALRSKIVSAAIYPLILAVGGTAAVLVLILVVLPNFTSLLENSGAALPTSTAIMMKISSTMRHYWPIFALLPV
ncbi:MAG TPA: type II secretion system F family protein, partial [Gemmatimonadaceae bacterium]|nr:type II secretion system F family protein [Gemmatimonadaceae bacterium]